MPENIVMMEQYAFQNQPLYEDISQEKAVKQMVYMHEIPLDLICDFWESEISDSTNVLRHEWPVDFQTSLSQHFGKIKVWYLLNRQTR